jgi:hypothetical protein
MLAWSETPLDKGCPTPRNFSGKKSLNHMVKMDKVDERFYLKSLGRVLKGRG